MRPSFASVAALAVAVCAAGCSDAAVDGGQAASDLVTRTVASPTPASPPRVRYLDTAGPAAPLPPQAFMATCRSDAFCDDFEAADPRAHWSAAIGGDLSFAIPSASLGSRSLRLTGVTQPTYLRFDGGPTPPSWWGALAVSQRVDAAPAQGFGGAELVAGDSSLGIVVTASGLALEQRTAGTVVRSTTFGAATSGAWQRVVIGVEVNPTTAAPYGRLEVTLDGGDILPLPLMVPMMGGSIDVHVGVTSPDTGPTSASFDDVMFFTR